ncbi:hypothetical protein QL285_093123 [Trifolium repens]|nr:hypothetical protein QL285_093123 [Trifolium repens]
MSGNKRKRKDNPTSLSELDPVALINRRNQSVDIQEPGSTPPALQSVTFRPATFQPQPALGAGLGAAESFSFSHGLFYVNGRIDWSGKIKEKGPNVDISDIHKETHIRKSTGGYVDTRSETTQRLYDEKIDNFLEKHPGYSNHDAIPRTIRRDIWQEVSGPGTKNTKYGFGKLAINIRHENLVHIPTPEERCRPVALPAAAQAEIEKLTRELQATKEELKRRDQQDQERHQMLQEEIRRVREEQTRAMDQQTRAMDQQRREVGAYIRELLASSSRNVPIDETNPQEDSTNSNNEDMGAN